MDGGLRPYPPLHGLSGENHVNAADICFGADDDLDVSAKVGEAFQHLRLADTAKLPVQHLGQLGLRQADDMSILRLSPAVLEAS